MKFDIKTRMSKWKIELAFVLLFVVILLLPDNQSDVTRIHQFRRDPVVNPIWGYEFIKDLIFGDEINQAFKGLQTILMKKFFPLVSEFVTSLEFLTGKFRELSNLSLDNNHIKWAILIKGKDNIVSSGVF